METMDAQILQLLGRYRIAVRPVLRLLTDDDSVPEASLARLVREELVTRSRALPGNRSIYQLTRSGAAQADVSEARARPVKAQALFKHLGILLFCHVPGSRRVRLEDAEVETLLGDLAPAGTHVMTVTAGGPLLLNLYVPGPRTSLRSVQRRLREQVTTARKAPALKALLRQRVYGFAVVTETRERRKAILAALRKPEPHGGGPLVRKARIHVEALPEFDRLMNGVPAPPNSKYHSKQQQTQ
jgi:hypothetical protein